jgi:delta14-sterol reductase/lamin-B receptor
MYIGWMVFHVVCERILPGEEVEGVTLPGGSKLKYTMSGHLQFWVTIVAMGHGIPLLLTTDAASGVYQIQGFRPLNLSLVYDHYVQLITISILGATLLSVYLYASSFIGTKILAKGGNTGSVIYDFFIGRELNPRIGSLDLKEFCELRPGLIGWFVLNLGQSVS